MKCITVVCLAVLALVAITAQAEPLDFELDDADMMMVEESAVEWITPSFVESESESEALPIQVRKPVAPTPAKRTAVPVAAPAAALVGSPCVRPLSAKPASIRLPANVVALGRTKTLAPHYPRGTCGKGNALSEADVRTFLTAAWTAFGATGKQLTDYVNRNVKQVRRESTFCPNILQGQIANDPNNNNPAGGLFQFIPSTFKLWAVKGFEVNRFNPLSNILAAVNAQVNAECINPAKHHRVLSGVAGWSPVMGKSSNPYKV